MKSSPWVRAGVVTIGITFGCSLPAAAANVSQKTLIAKYTKAIPGLTWTKGDVGTVGHNNREGIFLGLAGDPVTNGSVTFRLVDWRGYPLEDLQIVRRAWLGSGLLQNIVPKWKDGRVWLEDTVIETLRDLSKGKVTSETKKEISGWRITVLGMSLMGGDSTIGIFIAKIN